MFPLKDSHKTKTFALITYTIIVTNILIFIYQLTVSNIQGFIETWGFVPAKLDPNNPSTYVTLITNIFLHGGLMHILSNMWFLHIYGDNVEEKLGHFKFLLFYICGGIFASLTHYFFNQNSSLPGIGASGAIAAVLGFYLVFFSDHTITMLLTIGYRISTIELSAVVVLVMWFLLQLLNGTASLAVQTSSTGGVAWWAHIGGFVFGLGFGLIYKIFSKKGRSNEW